MQRRTFVAMMLVTVISLGCGLIQRDDAVETPTEVVNLSPTVAPTAEPTPTAKQPTPTATPTALPEPTTVPAPSESTETGVPWRAGGDGVFSTLGGLDTDGELVWVAVAYEGVRVFSLEGQDLGAWAPGEIGYVVDVKVGPQGTVYMADNALHQVTMFNRDGDLLGAFGGIGSGDGEFGPDGPRALAVGPLGEVFVLDPNQDAQGEDVTRIQVFSPEGDFLRDFIIDPEPDARAMDVGPDDTLFVVSPEGYVAEYVPDDGRLIQRLGLESLDGVLPQALAIDGAGYMYVTTQIPAAVAVLDPLGHLVGWLGEETVRTAEGWPEGELLFPFGVAVTDDGRHVFAGDTYESFAYVTAFTLP